MIINPCNRCGQPLIGRTSATPICGPCLSSPPLFEQSLSALAYAAPVNQLISQFKNAHQLSVGHVLSTLLAEHYLLQPNRPPPALLVPVPLHSNRLRSRGFNQALEIARVLHHHTTIPLAANLCHRVSDTAPQKGLSRSARRQSIRGAFRLRHTLRGERVALVDDVMTTGATLTELARTLLAGGAGAIEVLTLARTAAAGKIP